MDKKTAIKGMKKSISRFEKMEERIERNSDAICHAQGYPTRIEAAKNLIAAGQYIEDALLPEHIQRRQYIAAELERLSCNIYSLQSFPGTPQSWDSPDYLLSIGGRIIRFHRSDSASWSGKYKAGRWPDSKSITRYAYLLRADASHLTPHTLLTTDGRIEEKQITYEARGNWLTKVVVELLGIPAEPHRGKMHIQLDPHYRIALSRKIANVEIWARTLTGDIYDYCAVRGKDTYHAASPIEAVRGLAAKIAQPGSRKESLDMQYALSLGFCRSGIEQFCDDYNLDPASSYTRLELQSIVARGNGLAEKYESELIKIGIKV